ncbi:hypothetical protein EVAR_7042_1 [Eumeta japonica]|uniref:Uncharacterized protein n=1 Tax=Eumeta variegata TaxID=151549 RepID=A0A4C1YPR8_EUMVA|nr:hypothetical protein EVAR_7042_1 [Eumeta japonica]
MFVAISCDSHTEGARITSSTGCRRLLTASTGRSSSGVPNLRRHATSSDRQFSTPAAVTLRNGTGRSAIGRR